MEEMTRVLAPGGTFNEYEPSVFVTVPTRVPFTITEALGTGLPFASVTFPFMVRVWASSSPVRSNKQHQRDIRNFLIGVSIYIGYKQWITKFPNRYNKEGQQNHKTAATILYY
jgi:hypothetical protein